MGDDVKCRAVIIYAETGMGLQYIKKDYEGNFVLEPTIKGAATFTPVDAQKFIRAARVNYRLKLQAVK